MSKHEKFIKSSIIIVLQEALLACKSCGTGMETFPLCDYMMQSIFLQMTGFGEQKLKCILWELATDDFGFRHDFLKNNNYNECSSYEDKEKVFKSFINIIRKNNSSFDISSKTLLDEVKEKCISIFENSIMKEWLPRDYSNFKKNLEKISEEQILCHNSKNDKNSISFFTKKDNLKMKDFCVYEAYVKLYDHRNRCAHNLLSYQNDLPTLNTLNSDEYKYENWFIRFFILILIDEIFISLYREYTKFVFE